MADWVWIVIMVGWVLLPPKWDPAIRLRIWLEKKRG